MQQAGTQCQTRVITMRVALERLLKALCGFIPALELLQAHRQVELREGVLRIGRDYGEIAAGRLLIAPQLDLDLTADGIKIGGILARRAEYIQGFFQTPGSAQAQRCVQLSSNGGT